ncbi:MAG: hypothetical protein MUF51_01385, partial [Vicinamibacteria bacterium]|nr:hypothetical protein [Vicinamibacteria bacterium]
LSAIVCLGIALTALRAAAAPGKAQGPFTVSGQTVALTMAYARSEPGFFDEKKRDLVVFLTDEAVDEKTLADDFAMDELVAAGKLRYIKLVINDQQQIINCTLGHKAFKVRPSGASSEFKLETTVFDGQKIAGKTWTVSPQKGFDDELYEWSVAFDAVAPAAR